MPLLDNAIKIVGWKIVVCGIFICYDIKLGAFIKTGSWINYVSYLVLLTVTGNSGSYPIWILQITSWTVVNNCARFENPYFLIVSYRTVVVIGQPVGTYDFVLHFTTSSISQTVIEINVGMKIAGDIDELFHGWKLVYPLHFFETFINTYRTESIILIESAIYSVRLEKLLALVLPKDIGEVQRDAKEDHSHRKA